MESFKANFLIFIFVVIVSAAGYWAVKSINVNSGVLARNAHIDDVSPVVHTDPAAIDIKKEEPSVTPTSTNTNPTQTPDPKPTETTTNSKHADLISDLQELIDDNVLMKKGSKGTRVGTVQKFFIEYGVKMKVDNDYGDGMVSAVRDFQKASGLSADGQAGKSTYEKMIDWLESN